MLSVKKRWGCLAGLVAGLAYGGVGDDHVLTLLRGAPRVTWHRSLVACVDVGAGRVRAHADDVAYTVTVGVLAEAAHQGAVPGLLHVAYALADAHDEAAAHTLLRWGQAHWASRHYALRHIAKGGGVLVPLAQALDLLLRGPVALGAALAVLGTVVDEGDPTAAGVLGALWGVARGLAHDAVPMSHTTAIAALHQLAGAAEE